MGFRNPNAALPQVELGIVVAPIAVLVVNFPQSPPEHIVQSVCSPV